MVTQGCRPRWHPKILADQLTLSQPGGTDYAHLITTGTPGFSDLPTALMTSTNCRDDIQLQDFLLLFVLHFIVNWVVEFLPTAFKIRNISSLKELFFLVEMTKIGPKKIMIMKIVNLESGDFNSIQYN